VVLDLVVWLIKGVEAAATVADLGVEELHVGAAAALAAAAVVLIAAVVVAGELAVIQEAVAGSVSASMVTVVELQPVKS
jgi:hypothetical protein